MEHNHQQAPIRNKTTSDLLKKQKDVSKQLKAPCFVFENDFETRDVCAKTILSIYNIY